MTERNPLSELDEFYMREALGLAREAAELGEVPVGALVVSHEIGSEGDFGGVLGAGKVIARSGNLKEMRHDPLGHAEIRVIREAAQVLGRWRLSGCTLYVTLEPCVMCAGAIVHSRFDRVVYGATDPKAGAVESLYQILSDTRLNHRPKVVPGVLHSECSEVLSRFFAARRLSEKSKREKPSTS